MAVIADTWHRSGKLTAGGVVATVMSNLGLERYLKGIGLDMVRTPVGDRYVVEHMRKHGYNVGGEQSGHIVLSDYVTTGDGLITALQLLAVVVTTGSTVSEVTSRFEPLPQILKNVRYASGSPLEDTRVVQGDRRRQGQARRVRAGSSSARRAPSPSSASWRRATTSASSTPWSATSSRPCARLLPRKVGANRNQQNQTTSVCGFPASRGRAPLPLRICLRMARGPSVSLRNAD